MSALTRVSALGLGAFLAGAAAMHLVDPGFDASERTLSEFVHGRAPALLVVALLAWSISLAALGWLTLLAARRDDVGVAGAVQAAAIFLAAAGLLLVAAFPTDRGAELAGEVTRTTAAGRFHDLGSALATVGILAAAALAAARTPGRLRAVTVVLLSCGIGGSAILLAAGDPDPGLRQRLLILVACVWQGAYLLALNGRLGARAPTSGRSNAGSRCSTS